MTVGSTVISGLRPLRWLLPALLVVAVAGCENETETVEPTDTSYYQLEVGQFRIYEVTDTLWTNYVRQPQPRFQFRERVEEKFTDASGRTAYRVVRARRTTSTDAWRDDSVLVVSPSASNVLVTRNNRRTVELIYPVRTGYYWNLNAFNEQNPVDKNDFHYKQVGESFTTTSAAGQATTYPKTVTTALRETDAEEGGEYINAFYYFRSRQVYAAGTGPVYRSRRRFIYCPPGNCVPDPTRPFAGSTRTEVLIEAGR
ncbi:hypothetical protein [Hymenobacter sp. BT190]|uniref:hypothetical protein n=1 Tax=Hymenobacter sp. BT190 TaxID=2763505 RepID=UPI0016519299|nr:hypothetical protein [Hymenobacter sp. BT190]